MKPLSFKLNIPIKVLAASITTSMGLASLTLGEFTKDFPRFKRAVLAGITPNDSFYFTRIFSKETPTFSAENSYVGIKNLETLSNDSFSVPEILQRSAYIIFGGSIYENYIFFSFLYLSILIFTYSVFIKGSQKQNVPQMLLMQGLALMSLLLILGNHGVASTNYRFSRLVNPQFSILLWLLGLLLVSHLIRRVEQGRSVNSVVVFGALLTLISQYSYFFVFLSLTLTYFMTAIYLFLKNKRKDSLVIATIWMIILLQWFTAFQFKQAQDGFLDAADRMGFLKSHFPGAIETVLLSLVSIGLASFQQMFNSRRKEGTDFSSQLTAVNISSLSLIIASNSNVITGKSVQFSDHFEIFAYLSLGLCISLLIWKVLINFKYGFLVLSVIFSGIFVPQMLSLADVYVSKESRALDQELNSISFSKVNVREVAVESPSHADLIPVYAPVSVLFDTRIVSYAFRDNELLLRYFVSRGCPENLSASDLLFIYPYNLAPYYEKRERILQVLSWIRLNKYSDLFVADLSRELNQRIREMQGEVIMFYERYGEDSCLDLARSSGVKGIIFDGSGNWVNIVKEKNISSTSVGWPGLKYFSIPNE